MKCQACGGTGSQRCRDCEATGWRHELRTVRCRVEPGFSVDFQDSDAEVAQRYRSCDLPTLTTLAGVSQTSVQIDNSTFERLYQWESQITRLRIDALGETVTLTGFGAEARVFNFQNLVEILLRADLRLLQEAVAATRPWSFQAPAALLAAVKHCLLSEANAMIGEAGKDGNDLAAAGGVSGEFSRGTAKALRSALHRLYFGKAVIGLPFAVAVPSTFLVVADRTYWLARRPGLTLPATALVLAVTIAVTELIARARAKSMFGRELGPRVDRMLAGQKVLRFWRIVPAAVGLLGSFVTLVRLSL